MIRVRRPASKAANNVFKLCIIGTSLVNHNDVATAAKVSHWGRGWASFAKFLSKGLFDIPIWWDPAVRVGWEPSQTAGATRFFYGANCGVSGQTVALIAARIPEILRTLPKVDGYFLDDGTNDMSTLTKEAILASRIAVLNALRGTGKPVIVAPILARGITSWAAGSAERAKANWINQQTLEYIHKTDGLIFFDWNRSWINSADVNGAPFADYTPDAIHFSPPGGYAVGAQFAAFMQTIVKGQAPVRVSSQGDVFDATNNPRGNLITNPLCLNATGGVGTGVTGSVASLLRVERTAGTATAVASKETRPDNRGDWQVITVTPGDADSLFLFRTNSADTPHTYPAGTWVQACMDANIGAFNGWQGVSLYLKDNGTNGLTAYDMEPFTNDAGVLVKLPMTLMDGMLVTPPIKVVGDVATLRMRAEIRVASTTNGASGTGVVKFGALDLRACADPMQQLGYIP